MAGILRATYVGDLPDMTWKFPKFKQYGWPECRNCKSAIHKGRGICSRWECAKTEEEKKDFYKRYRKSIS